MPVLASWLHGLGPDPAAFVFPSSRGGRLSADALQRLVAKHVAAAAALCPSLAEKRITPHVLRHTTAMELRRRGIDRSVIALWLGHESMEVLANWKGRFVCDAYAGYHALFKGGGVVPISCWAHARRHFYDAFKGGDVDAAIVLTLIARLYGVEAEAKDRRLDPAAIRALRQERAKPEIDTLATVLEHLAKEALPKSPLGEAVAYARTLWPSLLRYLDDGVLPIDNNPAENAIRAVALGRKNWLFAGGDEGGRRAALFYSVLATCKSADVEPYAYLVDVLGRVQRTPVSQLAELTPRRWASARR